VLNAKVVVDTSNFTKNDKLLDAIIEDGFCILGTTNGLYTFTIPLSSVSSPQPTIVPTGLSANTQLFVVSSENEPQRSFKTLSNLYVLSNTFGVQQAKLNRFTIQDGVLTPFQDTLVAQGVNSTPILSSFISFSQYITNYFTDGSWNLASNYFLGTTQPSSVTSPRMLQLFTGIKTGQSSTHVMLPVLSSVVPLTGTYFANQNMVLGITRESTSGALMTTGSFGGLVNA